MIRYCMCTNQCKQCGSCCLFPCVHRGQIQVDAPVEPKICKTPTQVGWMCPRCGRVYSPDSTQCTSCNASAG